MAAKDDDEGILSLFLIDDHPVVGLGLSLALQGHSRFRLVGSIANPLLGLRTIETVRPDALIVDLVFDGEAELAFVAECRALLPHALIVVFSSLPRRFYEREVIDMGADAFVGKNADMSVLVETITEMLDVPRNVAGAQRLPREAGDAVVDGVHLTRREAEVAKRLGQGLSVLRIANDLHISPNTVGVHRDNIRKKLNCRDMTELVALLARHKTFAHDRT